MVISLVTLGRHNPCGNMQRSSNSLPATTIDTSTEFDMPPSHRCVKNKSVTESFMSETASHITKEEESRVSPCMAKEMLPTGIPDYVGCSNFSPSLYSMESPTYSTVPPKARCCKRDYTLLLDRDGPPADSDQRQTPLNVPDHVMGCQNSHAGAEGIESSCWVWTVVDPLPNVPQHAPLERASLEIKDLPLDTITARISNFLRINSISTSYSTQEPGRVDCQTFNCIKFVIQLWKNKEQDEQAIVVEVQRRRGCCILMRHLRNCLYKCILSGDEPCQNCYQIRMHRLRQLLQKKISDQLCATATTATEQTRDSHERSKRRRYSQGLDVCLDLLESHKADQNRLGIEFFLGLTDPSNMEMSHEAARALILNEGNNSCRLRRCLLNCFCSKLPLACSDMNEPSVASLPIHDHSAKVGLFGRQEYANPELDDSYVMALTALVTCLESVYTHEREYLTNDIAKVQLSTPFWTQLLEVLVYNIYDSSRRPREAALSAKSLRILENLKPELLAPIIKHFVAPMLKKANEFGKAHHWALEKESEQLALRYSRAGRHQPSPQEEQDQESNHAL